jgi:small GTP-binding protein
MQKKIALLGAAGVGKTSLVRRFVASLFDDKYLTTIGVKVDKKVVPVGDADVTLMIWDIAGAEEHFTVPTSYVKGAAGYLLVADGTRPATLDDAARLRAQVERDLGSIPFVVVINKSDLVEEWRVDAAAVAAVAEGALTTLETSAKTGVGVDDAFARLAAALST